MRNSKNIRVLLSALFVTSVFSINVQALEYTVQKGDSLYKIGQRHNISYQNIMADNNLKSTIIYPGQKINVNDNKKITHTVVKGDSLYKIAKKYGITVQAIKNSNSLKSDMIYPGQVFVIKGSNISASNEKIRSKSGVTYTQEELDLLSRLIRAEAGGESYNTQLAVGAVVLNRVKNAGFPNTIKDVIYEVSNGYYQFTPVLNGEINKPGNEQTLKAAKEALNGNDPTNNALYFFDNTITNNWLLSKQRALVEANMVFSY